MVGATAKFILKIANPPAASIDHAVQLIHAICGLAGSPILIDDIQILHRTGILARFNANHLYGAALSNIDAPDRRIIS